MRNEYRYGVDARIARQKWRAWIETFELNYEVIHCRTGSLESIAGHKFHCFLIHCRTGSLEIVAAGFFFGVAAKP